MEFSAAQAFCNHLIENKYSYGNIIHWTNQHFVQLSNDIFLLTGKRVSESTLKRFLGKKSTRNAYVPQRFTLNAIAEFLGYQNWDELLDASKDSSGKPKLGSKKRLHLIWIAVTLIMAIACWLSITYLFAKKAELTFQPVKQTQKVPFTTVFNYSLKAGNDSVFIDFGDRLLLPIDKNKTTVTEYVKAAGYHKVYILHRLDTLAKSYVHGLSKQWQAGFSPNDRYWKYSAFEEPALFKRDSILYLPIAEKMKLLPAGITDVYMEYRYADTFDISLDQLDLQVEAMNNKPLGGNPCFDIEVLLQAETGDIKYRFVHPGCFRYVDLIVSEKHFTGRFDDLSAFARDVSAWHKYSLKTANNTAYFFYDSDQIYSCAYRKQLGKLKAIIVRFYGNGALRRVSVGDTMLN
ncbi:MAG TPA: hypothetical protein VJ203_08445 [Bacteroidales bacterium]|nr:hypothetical protein [Bacteroidales bacterium]